MSELIIDLSAYEFDEFDDIDGTKKDDYMLALQLQMQIENSDNDEPKKEPKKAADKSSPLNLERKLLACSSSNDPEWDLIDPCPDIRALFQEYDKKYFWNRLGSCIVEWSKRMTICAGIFYLREGGIIRLSEPLLKYRPRTDLIDTLLHEMIHAYLYLTRNYKDRGEHGDEFKGHASRINKLANSHITVYHSFHDEVNACRQHVWRCTGPCRTHPPFYGYVKRSMNRAPGKNDTWWAQHQSKCNGVFEKVAEPEAFKQKQEKAAAKKNGESKATTSGSLLNKTKSSQPPEKGVKTLDTFFTSSQKPTSSLLSGSSSPPFSLVSTTQNAKSSSWSSSSEPKTKLAKLDNYFQQFNAKKEANAKPDVVDSDSCDLKRKLPHGKNAFDSDDDDIKEVVFVRNTKPLVDKSNEVIILDDEKVAGCKKVAAKEVECPMCFVKFSEFSIDSHVNSHF